MELLRWDHRPTLRRPLLVAAFEGWNDAGNAASETVSFLARQWEAAPFGAFDSEELFDFTSTRPQVRLEPGETRRLEWPELKLSWAALPGTERDVVLLSGPEPQLRWRSFAAELGSAAVGLGISTAVLVGSLLADVPHTRPVRVSGGAATPELASLARVVPSFFEGPTGILGVVADVLERAGIPTASLWASVPHYVSQSSSPKATLALVERTVRILGSSVDVVELQIATAAYERQINELVASDEDASAYVTRLEEQEEEVQASLSEAHVVDDGPRLGPASGERLAAEVERYLREHRQE
jgi:hypothetical protein